MISELLALAAGAFLGCVITASIYRSSQAINVRKAIASVQRYLADGGDTPFGNLTGKLKLHLDLINEADDLVTRSQWAQTQKKHFVAHSVRLIMLRNKGQAKANRSLRAQLEKSVEHSGQRLLGYLQFPSWLWLKAAVNRGMSSVKQRWEARATKVRVKTAGPESLQR